MNVIKEVFESLPIMWLGVAVFAVAVALFLFSAAQYKKSSYYAVTKSPYLATMFDTGRLGEYMIYRYLRHMEGDEGRFLFNIYLPKGDGETTEADVMLISTSGIFVFESKNYSGWIFGNENQQKWTQSLPRGRGKSEKNRFLNPIYQNKGHIAALKNMIGDSAPVHSVIVFSERCELKNVSVSSADISVIKRDHVLDTVCRLWEQNRGVLSKERVEEVYAQLYPMTQLSAEEKQAHVDRIALPKPESPVRGAPAEMRIAAINPMEGHSAEMEGNTCPRCGRALVLRTAKTGPNAGKEFWGCSGFPECRYIRNK